jgi:hypothetical protein
MARMIAPVKRRSTRNSRESQRSRGVLCLVRFLIVAFVVVLALALASVSHLSAHDLERTQVSMAFARDGSFVLDVANDPGWLKLRLENFPGSFADRVVLWVDGREVVPASVEYLPPNAGVDAERPLGKHRLRGRLPPDAHTLRWYYGLVIDPYPLTIRRADGRVIVEEIGSDAWSRTIDVSGQFQPPQINATLASLAVAVLLLVPVALRLVTKRSTTEDTEDREVESRLAQD